MAKKRNKDLGITKPAIGLTIGGSILGVGAGVAVAAGGSGAGLTAAAGFLPTAGIAIGAGLTVGQLRKLEEQNKRKRRR